MTLEAEFNQIADAFVTAQDLRGFKYERVSEHASRPPSKNHPPAKWDVVYHVTAPDGKLLEGLVIVVVDPVSKTAEFLDSP